MSGQLAIPQQLGILPISIPAAGLAPTPAHSVNPFKDASSEFAQLIQSLAPEPALPPAAAPKATKSAEPASHAAPVWSARPAAKSVLTTRVSLDTRLNASTPEFSSEPASAQSDTIPAKPRLQTPDPLPDIKVETDSSSIPPQKTTEVSPATETNTPSPVPMQESTKTAVSPPAPPPIRQIAPAKGSESGGPPMLVAPVPLPILILPAPLKSQAPASGQPPIQSAPIPQPEPAPIMSSQPALEVRLRSTADAKETTVAPPTRIQPEPTPTPVAGPSQTPAAPPVPIAQPVSFAAAKAISAEPALQTQAPLQIQSQPNAPVAVIPAAPQPVALKADPPSTRPLQAYEAAPIEPPAPGRSQPQPLRSVALEFTPDGASDVRLRVSERSGDVHIELHSTDPALTGRISAGVHDLTTSLGNAGYDAQAWMPGQDREGGQRQPQPQQDPSERQAPRHANPDLEDFDAVMQEPLKEFL